MAIIDKPSDYFRIKLYTGNSQNNTAITWDESTNMKPDFLWLKNRTASQEHWLCDIVRGAGYFVESDTDNAQQDGTSGFDSFDTNGFTVDNTARTNRNTMVGWGWLAGGSQGSSNTDGSINTTYTSVNTTAGFSISQYTGNATNGATVGHGLGVVPDMIIGKDLSDTSAWGVWHKDLTNAGYRLTLSSTAAQSDDSALFGGSSRTLPTSSVFTLGSGGGLNGSNANLAYCFAGKEGFSKFGKYIGNGNADGTFVYTGFKPAFVMIKSSSNSGQAWVMQDNKRDGFNYNNHRLFANSSATEESTVRMDLLSNGFKCRDNDGNGNGFKYIYMAFAENPFVASNFVSATAR